MKRPATSGRRSPTFREARHQSTTQAIQRKSMASFRWRSMKSKGSTIQAWDVSSLAQWAPRRRAVSASAPWHLRQRKL